MLVLHFFRLEFFRVFSFSCFAKRAFAADTKMSFYYFGRYSLSGCHEFETSPPFSPHPVHICTRKTLHASKSYARETKASLCISSLAYRIFSTSSCKFVSGLGYVMTDNRLSYLSLLLKAFSSLLVFCHSCFTLVVRWNKENVNNTHIDSHIHWTMRLFRKLQNIANLLFFMCECVYVSICVFILYIEKWTLPEKVANIKSNSTEYDRKMKLWGYVLYSTNILTKNNLFPK